MDDLRDLIQSRLAAADQHRADAPRRKEEAHRQHLEAARQKRQQQDKLLCAAIVGAKLLDFTFTFGMPDTDEVEYIGARNERIGNFVIVRSWKRYSFDTMRRLHIWAGGFGMSLKVFSGQLTHEAAIKFMLEYYRVDYLQEVSP